VPTLVPVEELVFICGALPDIGRSLVNQIDHDGALSDEWMAVPDPSTEAAARRLMFNDCDDATAGWGLTTVRIFNPPRVYEEVTPLKRWPEVPETYIVGMQDRIIRPEWSRRAVAVRLDVTPIEIEGGHCPQVSMPERLAELMDV